VPLFDIAERLATEVANMSIDYILEKALEIHRTQELRNGKWKNAT